MWVENVELVANQDEEIRRFEWDQEAEKWSGGENGGTDPALGWKGRHAVRSAWIAQHWGTGPGTPVIRPDTLRDRVPDSPGTLNAVDSRLEYAHDFLGIAISIAEERMPPSGRLHPFTLPSLLARHAGVLERIGSRSSLLESRSHYERIWAGLPGSGIGSARIATKLGDLNQRLGESEEALTWWARAIHLLQGESKLQHASLEPFVPPSHPPSPLAQRTLASALVSLSAFYSTSRQLAQAQAVQIASLDLLRSIPTPESSTSASPPEALHALYLLHRSSLISIHHAEILFALRQPIHASVKWLQDAARSSERVVFALSGHPYATSRSGDDAQHPQPPSECSLIPSYSESRVLNNPAASLLKNARRSAAEAWNLLGILSETHGSDPKTVLTCYERALGWAGVGTKKNEGARESGNVTETESRVFWANYVRAREAVNQTTGKT